MGAYRIGKVAAAVAAILGLGAFAMPLLQSDYPPWASRDSVTRNRRETKADFLAVLIVPLHSRECEALRARQFDLEQSYADQVMDYQRQYHNLTGNDYPLHTCP